MHRLAACVPLRFASGLLAFFVVVLPGGSSPVAAQPPAGQAQPDQLTFGTVRLGATVEASLRIFEDGHDATGITAKIEAPAFVHVKDKVVGTETYGNLRTKIYCDISLSIDTGKVADHIDAMKIQLGKQDVTVPVSVSVLPRERGLTRLLVVETPFQKFSGRDGSLFSAWVDLVKEAKLDVHYWLVVPQQPVLRGQDLSNFDVILLAQDGLFHLVESEQPRLEAFVKRGGRLILPANYFFRGTVAKANQLLAPHGLAMDDVEPPFGQNDQALGGNDIVGDPLTQEVQTLNFFRPSPVTVIDPAKGKLLVTAPPYPGKGFVAVGRSGKGEVVALGTSLWWNWIGEKRAQGSDNALLLRRLITTPQQKP